MKSLRHCLGAAIAALCLVPAVHAQLTWSVFNETTTVAGPASTATSGTVITVPAGQRVTLVANNFVPIDLTAAGSESITAVNFKVSGGLTTIGSGTRAVGYGLFNNNGTATNYADDSGYFTWLNGRATGALIEQKRRYGDGTQPSLMNAPANNTTVVSASTGRTALVPGALSDGNYYSIQFHLLGRSGSVSYGNTSSNVTGGGIVVSGPGITEITFSNPDTPASAFVFNEIAFMFLNTTSAPVTLTINSVTGVTPINPPAVATQPAAVTANPGQTVTLAPVITGTAPLTYQWKKDGANIAGATSATYAIASAATADAGSYTVTATNAYGTVTSNAAAVTVTSSAIAATITNQPASITRNVGERADFSVAAFGSSPVTYQWRKDGTDIAGATTNSLSLTSVTAANAGSYTVVVTSGAAGATTTATSSAATLQVNVLPAITTQPASITPSLGANVTFTVVATGSPTPTYQWLRNGVPIAGATSATLALNNITIANAGSYTVAVVNDAGAVTSAAAVLAIPSTMTVAAVSPANGASSVNIDAPLTITFDRAPTVGNSGRIRVFKASDDTVVDTIDLGSSLQQRSVGTSTTLFNFIPVTVSGNTASIYVHAGILAYGQTYYAQAELSTFLDSTGASFTGINDKTTWRFTTKSASTASATAITVAADGSADFNTVQGAIDSVPAGNTQRVVITVKKGVYNEIVYVGATKPFVTIRGEDRAQSIVGYPNNNTMNGSTATRASFNLVGNDSILENITIRNLTPQGGSQAEAVFTGALRVMLNRVNLLSRQDTLLTNTGTAFITDSYVEGNVDFMWGTASAYYQRCELKALDVGGGNVGYYTQVRNTAANFGNVYVDCKLTAAPGVVGTVAYYLGRIDPTPGNFPYSQCVYLNCAMGAHIDPAGWVLGTNNNVTSTTVQYWEYKSTTLEGASVDVSKRISSSRQLTDGEAVLWRNPAFVLGGWNPQLAPTIETSPAATSAVAGSNARLTVVANGAPQPALQWFKNGVAIPGATDYTLVLPNVSAADAGNYSVSATNALGTVTSAAGALTVTRGKYAGVYFGTVSAPGATSTQGTFALYIRNDGTGVLLASNPALYQVVRIDDSGTVNFTPTSYLSGGSSLSSFNSRGAIDANGNITATLSAGTPSRPGGAGPISATLSGARVADTGTSQNFAGYFQTGANSSAATTSFIVSATGQAFALVQNGATFDGGSGTVDATGAVSVTTTGGLKVTASVASGGGTVTAAYTPATGAAISLSGVGDSAASVQRLRELSARARVDATNTAVVGFVIAGDAPDSVLVRAVGPTLSDAFAVSGVLPNPKLDLYRINFNQLLGPNTLIATNTGWTNAANATEIALAGSQVGAFPLRTAAADSALRVTLAPGTYTAVMSSANGATAGIGLLEVYDITLGALGQRLTNLSVSGAAGNGANTLTAGLFIGGTAPKRVLIRAAGPALAGFGVTGPLAKPVLTLYRGATLVAQNAGWSTGADAANIAAASNGIGAFAFGATSADSALLLNLAAALYSVQVSSVDGATGTALIEIYELP